MTRRLAVGFAGIVAMGLFGSGCAKKDTSLLDDAGGSPRHVPGTAAQPGVAVRMLTSGTTGPPKRIDLQPQTLEVKDYPGYRREKFVFESSPGVGVLGYLLTPKSGKAPFPAVVLDALAMEDLRVW